MIRPTRPEDTNAVFAIASEIGFEPHELEALKQMLSDYFDGGSENFWLTDDDEDKGIVGVVYCEPERMTDQTWNLQLIAVRSDCQGQGHGGKLVHHVEETLKAQGGRILLVETLAEFDRTRAFYLKCGFEQEACIRDFYAAGADKIVFRKVL